MTAIRADAKAPSPPLTLTPAQVAEQLQVTRRSVYNLIGSGALRSIKVGGSRRITRQALLTYIEGLEASA